MADLWHYWGGDLSAAANGDVATVDGITLGVQRVIRRLMTAQGELIWHPEYGAGLPQRVGKKVDVRVITAIIRSQMNLEACVAKTPIPVVTASYFATGTLTVTIRYVDAASRQRVSFSFPATAQPYTRPQQGDISLEVTT